MLRAALFAVAMLAFAAPARAADPDLSGNWILANVGNSGERAICLLTFDTKDGKPVASPAFTFENEQISVSDVRVTATAVSLTVKRVRKSQGRDSIEVFHFQGVRGKDPKEILGSTGDYRFRERAELIATDREVLKYPNEIVRPTPEPEAMKKAIELDLQLGQASGKASEEKDPAKKKELQAAYQELRKQTQEKVTALYAEVVEKHPDSPVALDAALICLIWTPPDKLTAELAAKCVKVFRDQGVPYGPLFAAVMVTRFTDALAGRKGLEGVALSAIEPVAEALTDDLPAAVRSSVLTAYQAALAKAGKAAGARELTARIADLEPRIDAEYLKSVPPFVPAPFAGRKNRTADQVVVMELFTGTQCGPCIAADVAFDALVKAYKPTDLVLVQYHLHIPGPDPLTNPDTNARWEYYQKLMPEGIGGVPTSLFNGKPVAGSGGAMAAAENKFRQYTDVINPLLEMRSSVKVTGKATRNGDRLDIAVEVAGGDGADMKLRLLVVEESVKYVGGNGIRFHHHVVRAMPGGAGGVAVKGDSFKHTTAADLGEVRKGLTKYLDKYIAENPNRPFARPDRPMDMKAVRVIALVQNDKAGEIAQAVQIEVGGNGAGR